MFTRGTHTQKLFKTEPNLLWEFQTVECQYTNQITIYTPFYQFSIQNLKKIQNQPLLKFGKVKFEWRQYSASGPGAGGT